MNIALQELTSRLAGLTREQLLSLDPEELARADNLLTAAGFDRLDQRCGELAITVESGCLRASESSGPLYWLQNHTLTTDDHWQIKGTPAKAPFPRKSYFEWLFGAMAKLLWQPELKKDALFVPKSRDMLVSWSVMGFITWMCQFRPQTFWIAQSAKEDKAVELVQYSRTLYHNQDEFLRERHPLEADTNLEIRWKNGSRILGLPAGEDQVRIHHPFGWFADEAAFLPDFIQCFDAVRPVAAQIVAVSTAAPGAFADECAR